MNREAAVNALSMVLKQPKHCESFEEYIYKQTKKDPAIYTWSVYQVVGLLMKNLSDLKSTAKAVKEGKIGWKSPTYDQVADRMAEFDEYLAKPFEVVEGVVECGKCHSKRTWSVQKQTRSSDEPMTTFTRCVECGHQWAYSG